MVVGFLDGEDALYEDGERVMTIKVGRQGDVLRSRTEFGRRIYTIKDDSNVVFEAEEEDLIGIW